MPIDSPKTTIRILNQNGLIHVRRWHTFPPRITDRLALSSSGLFADGTDFSWDTIQKGRNLYYQKQTAEAIQNQASQTTALLTSALNHHLNIGQNATTNTSSVFMSVKTLSLQSIENTLIRPVGNVQIQLPSTLISNETANQTVSLRVDVHPLAVYRSSSAFNNLSTTISLSILDQTGEKISLPTTFTHPYRFVIPRDPAMIVPAMVEQNVTSFNTTAHRLLFNLHYVDITQPNNLTVAVHIEMQAQNQSLGYVLIYRFDQSPYLNSTVQQIDGFSLLCPTVPSASLSNDSAYSYFLDNAKTKDRRSVIFGLREMNSTETIQFCSNQSANATLPPLADVPFHFTSNYELRVYTSGCYYFDERLGQWLSDGVLVSAFIPRSLKKRISLVDE